MSTTTDHLENVFSDTLRSPLRPRPQVDLCRRGEIRAEKFLDAATEVFAEKGYQHARLSEIVARYLPIWISSPSRSTVRPSSRVRLT